MGRPSREEEMKKLLLTMSKEERLKFLVKYLQAFKRANPVNPITKKRRYWRDRKRVSREKLESLSQNDTSAAPT